jgi:hypothetical protein
MELGLGLGFLPVEANYEARVFVEKKKCSQTHNPFTQKKRFFKANLGIDSI